MAEPQRPRPRGVDRRTSEVVHVLDPELITAGRTAKGLSPADLAALCGKSRSAIWRIEAGALTKILPSFARDLARELDLDPQKAFGVLQVSTPSNSCSRDTS